MIAAKACQRDTDKRHASFLGTFPFQDCYFGRVLQNNL